MIHDSWLIDGGGGSGGGGGGDGDDEKDVQLCQMKHRNLSLLRALNVYCWL
jgi:hypothetical protein